MECRETTHRGTRSTGRVQKRNTTTEKYIKSGNAVNLDKLRRQTIQPVKVLLNSCVMLGKLLTCPSRVLPKVGSMTVTHLIGCSEGDTVLTKRLAQCRMKQASTRQKPIIIVAAVV